MENEKQFDLIVKGSGVCLLGIAIYFFANAMSLATVLLFHKIFGIGMLSLDSMSYPEHIFRHTATGSLVASLVKVLILTATARNFLTTGSIVKAFTRKIKAEQTPAGDRLKAPPEE